MEALCSSETLVLTIPTRRNIPEDGIFQLYSVWQEFEMDKQMQTTIHYVNEQLKALKLEIERLKRHQKSSEITSQ
jgi:hypothetical protein